jgi:hypothetical protein
MTRRWIEGPVLCLLLLVCPAWGQKSTESSASFFQRSSRPAQPPPTTAQLPPTSKKSELEEMLSLALETNPDIRVAQAKLAEAQAQLTRARLQAMQQVVTQYQAVTALREQQKQLDQQLALVQEAVKAGASSTKGLLALQQKVVEGKTALAAAETQLLYLLGKSSPFGQGTGSNRTSERAIQRGLNFLQQAQYPEANQMTRLAASALLQQYYQSLTPGPVQDKLRQALNNTVSLQFKEAPLDDIISQVQKQLPAGVLIKLIPGPNFPKTLSLDLKNLPLGAALQYLEDSLPGSRVVVRGYGLLIADAERLPPTAPGLETVWKGKTVLRTSSTYSKADLGERIRRLAEEVKKLEEELGKSSQKPRDGRK